ncbi:MAG: 50S ribosomal protein L9 [Gemmatimonadales bacterium]
MEVILREDIKTLGKAGDLVKVKPGYARNFLLPKGLAYEATDGNRKRIDSESKARLARHAEERTGAEAMAATLAAAPLALSRKAGEGDRLFGSITAQDLADALAAQGIELDRRRIELEHPIKTVGQHTVMVRLHADVHAELHVTITAE